MVLPIYVYGSKVLHQRTTNISEEEFQSDNANIKKMISDMLDTMISGEGIGLAANQVGILKSVIVLNQGLLDDEDGGQVLITNLPSVLINPRIVEESEEVIYAKEGCLSFPHLTASPKRSETIVVEYRDELFQPQTLRASGMGAVVLQHEIDHLHGMTLNLRVHGIERKRLDVVIKQITRSKAKIEVGYPVIVKK